MKLKAIIIDDELVCRDAIRIIVDEYCKNVEIVSDAESVSDAVEKIKTHKPDFIFLDIEIKEGTGFDVLSQLNTQEIQVIFVTGFNHFAIKAFKFSALDYILKPINSIELIQAINKVVQNKTNNTFKEQLEIMQFNNHSTKKKIAIPTHEGLSMIWINEIVRCEADNSYTSIFCTNGKRFVVSRSIKDYEELFSDFKFLRVHQSHLINLEYVCNVLKEDGGTLIMEDQSKIPIARRRKEKLMNLLLN